MTCSEISNQLFVGLFTIWLTAILFLLLPYRLPYVKINSGDIMTILSASQIRAVEQTANDAGLPFRDMMEKAGKGCAGYILQSCGNFNTVCVLIGKGKNGGDGYVLSRYLANAGKKVFAVKMFDCESDSLSESMKDILPDSVELLYLSDNKEKIFSLIEKCDIITDAVFGIGFSGALPEHIKEVFCECAKSKALKIAIDVPSGLSHLSENLSDCFRADRTLSMLAYKKEHIYKPYSSLCGKTSIIPIGIQINSKSFLNAVTAKEAAKGFPERKYNSHKGTFGHALLLTGSRKYPGAAVMATRGALNTGAGLVTLAFPDCCYNTLTAALSECIFSPLESDPMGFISDKNTDWLKNNCNKFSAIAAGCGMGQTAATAKCISTLIKNYKGTLIIDADGINSICDNINILKDAAGTVCLTPHPGEMSRLTGLPVQTINEHREEIAASFAKQFGCFVVLKGANTVIATDDATVFVNTTGNPALSRGGSGDLLTGIAVSLSAQGNSPLQSLISAVYLHGLTGDIAAEKYTQFAATVERITDCIPEALSQICEKGL